MHCIPHKNESLVRKFVSTANKNVHYYSSITNVEAQINSYNNHNSYRYNKH